MANRYTQIYNTPFVPQYQPPNTGVYQQSANVLNQRQEQGMQQYDALQESLNQLDVLPTDQKLLEQKKNEVNSSLEEFSDTNDFIDSLPAIRRQARNLQKETQTGDLGTAIVNKQNATDTFERINDSDWSPEQKEAMKRRYLEDYNNASESGRLDVYTPPTYVNVEEEAAKAAKSVDETTYDTIQYVKDEGTGEKVKAKVKRSGRELSRIRRSVTDMFSNNDEVRNALITEARLNGNRTSEDIQDYVAKKAESTALDMQTRFGSQDTTFSGIQWDSDDMKNVASGTKARDTVEPGIIQAQNIIPNLPDHLSEMKKAKIEGNSDKFEMLKDGLDSVATTALEQGDLNMDDYNYFIDNIRKRGDEPGFGLSDVLDFAGEAVNRATGTQTFFGESEDQRFKDIASKIGGVIEDNEGIVGSTFLFTNPESKANKQMNQALENSSPQNFDVVSSELVEDMDEEERNQFIKQTITDGTPEGITFISDDHQPFYKFRKQVGEGDDAKYETVFLKEKSTPNIKKAGYKTPFETVANSVLKDDDVAQQLLGTYKLHNVPTMGDNVYENLPSQYKMDFGNNNYLSLQSQEGGDLTVDVGTEDEHNSVTKWDYLNTVNSSFSNLYRYNPDQAKEYYGIMSEMINKSSTLIEREKKSILENLATDNDISNEIVKKLKEEFDIPHKFSNKVEAINFARTIK